MRRASAPPPFAATRAGGTEYKLTDFQALVHAVPEGTSRFLGGGRGGAKSEAFAQRIAFRSIRHGADARILYLRQGPYKSLNDFEETLGRLFSMLWGPSAHALNHASRVWTTPTNAYIELGILPDGAEGRRYYERAYQGRSFTDILIDEAQQWSQPDTLDILLSNLRGPIPTEVWMAANPGGVGHQWLASRFVLNGVEPWTPFEITKEVEVGGKAAVTTRTWVYCPSTHRDNPHNGPDYVQNLAASCGNDAELLAAWLSGDWRIARGAYFAASLDNAKIRIDWPDPSGWEDWSPVDWRFWLAYDHGTTAPAPCYVMAKSPGAKGPDGRHYPAGSLLVLDEWVEHRPGDLSKSFGWDVSRIAPWLVDLARRWRIPALGVADDACFGDSGSTAGTIADEYARFGVVFRPAKKGSRAGRFLRMKRMFAAAGSAEEEGLYVSSRCRYFWQTVPFLVHDPRDPEVPLKCGTDHGLDAVSYGISGADSMAGVLRNVE